MELRLLDVLAIRNLRLKFVVSMVSRTSLYEVIPIHHIVFISGDSPLGKKNSKTKTFGISFYQP